ncbi:MAG: phosphoglucosamine mutase [Propionibacteriaceae bacterium]|jgi:phosphoglucosamine mutase|nr:phosphoglucosamine mutase [Propionibacteriaceae bacterium]
MARLFGTDGVRGRANADLTAELALELSIAAAHVLGEADPGVRLRAVVGRDPRASGEFLEAAVVAGLASAGVDVMRVGIVPTPGLAFLVTELGVDFGVMLSASHNPMPDNGIKFFGPGGVKLPDDVEDLIEEELDKEWVRPTGDGVGRVTDNPELVDRYVSHLLASLKADRPLEGLKIVLDPANGAASRTAVKAFMQAGASVTAIHNKPNGLNINDNCGSTHIEALQLEVISCGADLGIGLDGDADRCIAVDANGRVVDGDQILAILALAMKDEGRLHQDTVVATVMSNLGFFRAMKAHGINVDTTKVGDRYVVESMNANGFTLGGEQSGHVVMNEFATTGDGTLTGLHVAARVVQTGQPLAELGAVMKRLPQVIINVGNVDRGRTNLDQGVVRAVAAAETALKGAGRVVLRPSGTEPVVRVMVEADTEDRAREVAEGLAEVVRVRLALGPVKPA